MLLIQICLGLLSLTETFCNRPSFHSDKYRSVSFTNGEYRLPQQSIRLPRQSNLPSAVRQRDETEDDLYNLDVSSWDRSLNYKLQREAHDDDSVDEASESARIIEPHTISKIAETLGAINTVSRYIVKMTKGESHFGYPNHVHQPNENSANIPSALLTISKNIFGKNVTKTIAPFVQELLPSVLGQADNNGDVLTLNSDYSQPVAQETHIYKPQETHVYKPQESQVYKPQNTHRPSRLSENTVSKVTNANQCTTPDGEKGVCDDLSDCPQLLLNLTELRQSLCFKSFFEPGVCCPMSSKPNHTTKKPSVVRPVASTTLRYPVATTGHITKLTTQRPTILKPVKKDPPVVDLPTSQMIAQYNKTNSLLIDPEDCGQPEVANFRIVGGDESPSGKWPWMAAIYLHGVRQSEFWCGGALITARHVLTAAHCTKDAKHRPFSPRQFTVRLGDVNLAYNDEPSSPLTVNVADIKVHPQFSGVGFYNDIAVFYLDAPVSKSKYIIPICLPSVKYRNDKFSARKATVVGWGTTYYGGKESTIQREAILPIWRNEDCNQAYFQPITENFVCAGYSEGHIDACQGDSGGPLMLELEGRWTQVGIVSFGNKCGEPGYPGVYTRLTHYIDWIESITGYKRTN